MAKKDYIQKLIVTGKGELTGFISICKPSQNYRKYQAQILLSKEEGEALVKTLEELQAAQFVKEGRKGKLAPLPCQPYAVQDKDTGKEIPDKDGRYILKTNLDETTSKGTLNPKPIVINAHKQPVTGNLNIGEGTIARLQVLFKGYKAPIGIGVSAKLKGVQIINLVEYQNNNFSIDMFDEEEGFDGVGEEFTEEEVTTTEVEEADEEEVDF